MTGLEGRDGGRTGLLTPRLVLRPTRPEDAGGIEELARSNLRDEIADARAWMARARLSPNAIIFSMFEASSQNLIGSAGIAPVAGTAGESEICLWVGEPFCGRGYGTQAARAVIDHAFSSTPVGSLWFVCRTANHRARRMIERVGFEPRESGMERSVALRAVVPVERYKLDRRAWQATAASAPAKGSLRASGPATH